MTTMQMAVRSTVGRKVLMALSGAGILGWLVLHVAGNLLVFRGAEVINGYGRMLHENPLLLWGQRLAIGTLLLVHVVTAAQLEGVRRTARPQRYTVVQPSTESRAARAMRFTGPAVLVIFVYHLMLFTFGNAHPDFVVGDVHHNLTVGLSSLVPVVAHVMLMLLVGWHLFHGGRSLFYSLGLVHPTYEARVTRVVRAGVLALVALGMLIPVGLALGVGGS
ncbi:MAG: hypothetical protein AB2A00_23745 [Myxococcota bacterium]